MDRKLGRLIKALAVVVSLGVSGCMSVQVKPANVAGIKHVCIVENTAVIVPDFLSVVREGFSRHGITSDVMSERDAQACDARVTYTANHRWDMKMFLTHAEIHLWRGNTEIGQAQYHHKGGLSLSKYGSTKSKVDPVIDELLKNR